MNSIAIIIPVGPGEQNLNLVSELLGMLEDAPELDCRVANWQIIVSFCEASAELKAQLPVSSRIKSLVAEQGRAQQMNAAAATADTGYLWFVHLDSVVCRRHLLAMAEAVLRQPDRLHYFALKFAADGNGPTWLNQTGANLRSRLLGVPFGDQALCISAQQFRLLGGYPESVSYGEDHVFVWRARQAGICLNYLSESLSTSAVKYARSGWLKLTWRYQYLWLKQAAPEFWLLVNLRFSCISKACKSIRF